MTTTLRATLIGKLTFTVIMTFIGCISLTRKFTYIAIHHHYNDHHSKGNADLEVYYYHHNTHMRVSLICWNFTFLTIIMTFTWGVSFIWKFKIPTITMTFIWCVSLIGWKFTFLSIIMTPLWCELLISNLHFFLLLWSLYVYQRSVSLHFLLLSYPCIMCIID